MTNNLYADDVLSENVDNDKNDCECGYEETSKNVFPENPVLGQSYVPIQYMDKTFKPCVGLKMGTIFPELVNPYYPCQSMEENAFIEAMNTVGEGCNKC
ncbi:MAG: spore coat associated protein CotJA [Clostridia bacterium]|nr:spore coat associated protein CotJA [Clostridia bacterium]